MLDAISADWSLALPVFLNLDAVSLMFEVVDFETGCKEEKRNKNEKVRCG